MINIGEAWLPVDGRFDLFLPDWLFVVGDVEVCVVVALPGSLVVVVVGCGVGWFPFFATFNTKAVNGSTLS